MGAEALAKGGPVFGHRAAAFLLPSLCSGCLTAPEQIKGAQPKDSKLSIAIVFYRLKQLAAKFIAATDQGPNYS